MADPTNELTVGANPPSAVPDPTGKPTPADPKAGLTHKEIKDIHTHQMASILTALTNKGGLETMSKAIQAAEQGDYVPLQKAGILIKDQATYDEWFNKPDDASKFADNGNAVEDIIIAMLLRYYLYACDPEYAKLAGSGRRSQQRGDLADLLYEISISDPRVSNFVELQGRFEEAKNGHYPELHSDIRMLEIAQKQKQDFVMHVFQKGHYEGVYVQTSQYIDQTRPAGVPRILKVFELGMSHEEIHDMVRGGKENYGLVRNGETHSIKNHFADLRFKVYGKEYAFSLVAEERDGKPILMEYKVPIVNGEPNFEAKTRLNCGESVMAQVTGEYSNSKNLSAAVVECYRRQGQAVKEALNHDAKKTTKVTAEVDGKGPAPAPSAPPPPPRTGAGDPVGTRATPGLQQQLQAEIERRNLRSKGTAEGGEDVQIVNMVIDKLNQNDNGNRVPINTQQLEEMKGRANPSVSEKGFLQALGKIEAAVREGNLANALKAGAQDTDTLEKMLDGQVHFSPSRTGPRI